MSNIGNTQAWCVHVICKLAKAIYVERERKRVWRAPSRLMFASLWLDMCVCVFSAFVSGWFFCISLSSAMISWIVWTATFNYWVCSVWDAIFSGNHKFRWECGCAAIALASFYAGFRSFRTDLQTLNRYCNLILAIYTNLTAIKPAHNITIFI